MGSVDVTTRFTHYNSYKLDAGEELYGTPFDVEYFSAINSQAQVICKGSSATGAMYVTWLGADGSKLGREEFEFDVTGRWVRQTWANEPPEHAVRAMWSVKNTHATEAWNVACAMTSAGEMAGAFDPALANQVSLLTASGLYTGTVTADQVVTGLLQANDGRAWFDLDKPEIVMNGDSAKWVASPENPLRLEDGEGAFLGGLIKQGGRTYLASSGLVTSDDPEYFILAGDVQQYEEQIGAGINAYHKNNPSVPIAQIEMYGDESAGAFLFRLKNSHILLSDASIPYKFEALSVDGANGAYVMRGDNGFFEIYVHDGSGTISKLKLSATAGSVLEYGNHALGVDATGPYRVKNGTKTYF